MRQHEFTDFIMVDVNFIFDFPPPRYGELKTNVHLAAWLHGHLLFSPVLPAWMTPSSSVLLGDEKNTVLSVNCIRYSVGLRYWCFVS